MARLPKVGDDKGTWGGILNDYLQQSHDDGGQLKADTVGASQLVPNAVTASALADEGVTNAKLSDGAVSTSKIQDGAVGTSQLADSSVTAAKLQDAGQANGIATLDATAKLPEEQLPERLEPVKTY